MLDSQVIKTEINENKHIIFLEGRIDSNKAPGIDTQIMDIVNKCSDMDIEINCRDLEYISSAGLRVLMKVCKSMEKKLSVYDVSSDVYDIFETTGFTELMDVHKALRNIDVTGCDQIGKGGNGTIYRLDEDTIVKVYKPWMKLSDIEREREYARNAFINGIPSVIAYDVVKCDDCYGVVFEMLKSNTLGHAMKTDPDRPEEYVDKYVELAKTLHTTHVKKKSFERIQDVYHRRIDNMAKWCSKEEMELLHSITDDIPEADTITHNDLHPGNIMIQDGELVLIDMPEVTMGPPICDLVSIYRDMIMAPSGNQSDHVEQSVGIGKEMIIKVGNMFFMKYTLSLIHI